MLGELALLAFMSGLHNVTQTIVTLGKGVTHLPKPLVFYVGKKIDAIKGDIADILNVMEYYVSGGTEGKTPADYHCGDIDCKAPDCKPENGPKSAEPTSTPQDQATAIGPAPSAN